jgi:hypothetical protein
MHSRSNPDRQSLYSGRSLPVLVGISFPWFTPLTAIRCSATLFTTEFRQLSDRQQQSCLSAEERRAAARPRR